jgi:hypothetical protein
VGARAEIVRQFLSSESLARSASDLAEDAGFMKRNVAGALDALRLGGALDSTKTLNKLAYRLRQPVAWRTLLGELPRVWPRWSSILPALSRASDAIDHLRTLPARSATVEINKTARNIAPLVERAHLQPLPSARDGQHGLDAFEDWVHRTATALASGDSRAFIGGAESA